MYQQALRWAAFLFLSILIVCGELVALFYRPNWVWAVVSVLTLLIYITALSDWMEARATAFVIASALVALLAWPFGVMALLGPDEDRLPSLLYGLLYFGMILAGSLLIVRIGKKLRAT